MCVYVCLCLSLPMFMLWVVVVVVVVMVGERSTPTIRALLQMVPLNTCPRLCTLSLRMRAPAVGVERSVEGEIAGNKWREQGDSQTIPYST